MIQSIIDIQWHDNVKARVLDRAQRNKFVQRNDNVAAIRSQEAIHAYLAAGKKPRMPKSNMQLSPKLRKKSRKD